MNSNQNHTTSSFWQILFVLWMISSLFSNLINLPVVQFKLQLFEILFLVFSIRLIPNLREILSNHFFLKRSLGLYCLVILFNMAYHFNTISPLDNLGSLYLCLVPLVFGCTLLQFGQGKEILKKGFLGIAISLPIATLLGYLLHHLGITSYYVFVYENYPYLGDVVRLKGFSGSPNEVVFIGAITIFYLLNNKLSKSYKTLLIGLLTMVMLFTFSKEIVLVFCSLIGYYFINKNRFKVFSWFIIGLMIISFVSLTFFYFSFGTSGIREDIIQNEVLFTIGGIQVLPTSYYFLFKSSLIMIQEYFVAGVGFGNYIETIKLLQQQGRYPQALYPYHAHDNYTGLIAQYGMLFILVLLSFWQELRTIIRNIGPQWKHFVICSILFTFFYGFIVYSYHMRFMWMWFGVLIYLFGNNEEGRK